MSLLPVCELKLVVLLLLEAYFFKLWLSFNSLVIMQNRVVHGIGFNYFLITNYNLNNKLVRIETEKTILG